MEWPQSRKCKKRESSWNRVILHHFEWGGETAPLICSSSLWCRVTCKAWWFGLLWSNFCWKYKKLIKNLSKKWRYSNVTFNCIDHSCDYMWPYVYGWTITGPIFSTTPLLLVWDCTIFFKWPYRFSFCLLLSKLKCKVKKVQRKTFWSGKISIFV